MDPGCNRACSEKRLTEPDESLVGVDPDIARCLAARRAGSSRRRLLSHESSAVAGRGATRSAFRHGVASLTSFCSPSGADDVNVVAWLLERKRPWAARARRRPGPAAIRPDAPAAPFRREGGDLFRRAKLPRLRAPVHRSGGNRRRGLLSASWRRLRDEHTPWARALPRQGRRPRLLHGRAIRQGLRVLPWEGRLAARHRCERWHARSQRDRRRVASRSPSEPHTGLLACATPIRSSPPSSATARPARGPSTRPATWRVRGSCRWCSCARTISTASAPARRRRAERGSRRARLCLWDARNRDRRQRPTHGTERNARRQLKRARRGDGPTFLECRTWRHRAHVEGEQPQVLGRRGARGWLDSIRSPGSKRICATSAGQRQKRSTRSSRPA